MNTAVASLPKLCTTCGARYPADALFCPSDGTPLQSTGASSSDHDEAAPDPYLGREISGHIEIRQLAGVGAMGRVYRAFQRGIDRDVAVKVLHRELSANQQLVSRFHREAKVASRLQHPNVVQVHLAGQLPDGAMYIVMEYLDGLSLQSALAAASGALPLPRALHIGLQVCDAAGEAHAQGVIHRDLKPENVMLVRRGDDPDYVKVLDFGIARLNWGEQSMATAAGLIFGTARYISPEGAQGESVGPASDVYSIATLLYQMLSGRTPFEGDQAVALLVQQIHDAPPHLKSIARSAYVPDAIAELVMQNLAKNPQSREEEARALGRALLDAAKVAGFAPEELIARSGLLSGRSSGSMHLAPIQRTHQLQLDVELSQRLSPPPTQIDPPPSSKRLLPADDTGPRRPLPTDLSPGMATTKWVPPPGFEAKLVPIRKTSAPGVDATLDESSAVPPAVVRGGGASTTEYTPPPPASVQAQVQAHMQSMRSVAPSKPPSGVETTLSDDDHVTMGRERRSRVISVVILCFLLGAGAATGIAYKMGRIGAVAGAPAPPSEEAIGRANDALKHERWIEPPRDNVRDLTREGLAKWPAEPRFVEIRERAASQLVEQALARRSSGDVVEALRLAKMAREIDPRSASATHLVEVYEAELAMPFPSSLPLAGTAGANPAAPRPPAQVLAYKVLLDASPAKPRVGQTVEFAARISSAAGAAPRSKPEGATLEIDAPGIAPIKMSTMPDATGVQRAAYTFLEAGRYEITFSAKVDGVSLRASRTVIAGDPAPSQSAPAASASTTPAPAPSGSVKWL